MSYWECGFGLGGGADVPGAGGGSGEGGKAYRAHEDVLNAKFRYWRGRSGRSYAFSVYAPADCPAYDHAVLVVATRAGEALAGVDLGAAPEAELLRLRARFAARLDALEFQVHVLAEREADRRALIADIVAP